MVGDYFETFSLAWLSRFGHLDVKLLWEVSRSHLVTGIWWTVLAPVCHQDAGPEAATRYLTRLRVAGRSDAPRSDRQSRRNVVLIDAAYVAELAGRVGAIENLEDNIRIEQSATHRHHHHIGPS